MTRHRIPWAQRHPMVRIVIPYLLGLLCGKSYGPDPAIPLVFCGLSMVLVFLSRWLSPSLHFRLASLQGIGTISIPLATGMATMGQVNIRLREVRDEVRANQLLSFQIRDVLSVKPAGITCLASVSAIEAGHSQELRGQCLVYLAGATENLSWTGLRLYAMTRLEAIEGPMNPGEVNFQEIYAARSVFYRAYVPLSTLVVNRQSEGSPGISLVLVQQRNRLLQWVRTYIRSPEAAGLAEAMFVGYRRDLSPDLAEIYARTGVMHVIAISGLHLGLIFSLLLALFSLLPGKKNKPWLVLLLAIPAIWWFSLLTGASASVIRSAVMCTLPVGAALMGRRPLSANIFLSSLLVLLAWNPLWLWDTGFQLSYAAVAGIMLYQRRIQAWIPFRHPWALTLWELISVTLAAQVFTTPLVIHYFHQSPLLFLLSNLVAVPLSSLILLGTLVTCLSHPMPSLATFAGRCTEALIRILNDFIDRIDRVPHTMIRDLHLDAGSVCLVCTVALFILRSRNASQRPLMVPGISMIMLLSVWLWRQDQQAGSRQTLTILQVRGQSVLIQIDGRNARQFILPGEGISAERTVAALHALRMHYRSKTQETRILSPVRIQQVFTGRKKILVVAAPPPESRQPWAYPPDLILLTRNAPTGLSAWQKYTGCKVFVADGSNALWKIQEWQKEAKKLPLRLHSTPRQGAFLLD